MTFEAKPLDTQHMTKVLSCPKCSFETSEVLARCPSCGSRLQSKRKVKILGWVLLVLGTFLVVVMGGLGIYLGQLIAQSGKPGSGTRFTGGPNDVAIIMAVFGLVIAFGISTMVGGIWQIKYGKPNRKLMLLMFLVAGILLVIASAIEVTG